VPDPKRNRAIEKPSRRAAFENGLRTPNFNEQFESDLERRLDGRSDPNLARLAAIEKNNAGRPEARERQRGGGLGVKYVR
jgi:hypothetical protein